MEALTILGSCVSSVVPLAMITLSGVVLAKAKLFNDQANHMVASACAKLLFPVLYGIILARSATLSKLTDYWFLLVNPFVVVGLASALCFLVVKLLKIPRELNCTLVAVVGFTNFVNMPLILVEGSCSSYGPLSDSEHCDDIEAYIILQTLVYNLLTWSYGYYLVQVDSNGSQTRFRVSQVLGNLKKPVPVGTLLGLVFGLIPGIKEVFFEDSAPLLVLSDSFYTVSYTGLILSQIELGSNLILTKTQNSKLSKLDYFWVLGLRLVVLPLIGLGYTYLLDSQGIIHNLSMGYIVYLNFLCPTAIAVLVISQLLSTNVQETTLLIFYMYLFSLVSVTLFSILFFMVFKL